MDAPPSPSATTSSSDAQPAAAATGLLRALRTETTLAPKNQSQSARVLSSLNRIASVTIPEVVKEDGHRFFVVDIRMGGKLPQGLAKSSISTTTASESITGSGSPLVQPLETQAVQTRRRFVDFSNLRHELYYHANAGHRNHAQPCAFCAHVLDVLSHAATQPRLHSLLLHSTDSLRQQLEDFLSLVVQLATQAKDLGGASSRWCEGREMVPLLVKQFLLGDDGETDASDASTSRSRPVGWAYTTAWAA